MNQMLFIVSILLHCCIAMGVSDRPLAKWLDPANDSRCLLIQSAFFGLGCELTNLWWAVTILKQQEPSRELYYNFGHSKYQCTHRHSLTSFFLPSDDLFKLTDAHTMPRDCKVMERGQLIELVRHYLLEAWHKHPPNQQSSGGIFRLEPLSPALEHDMIRARCEVVRKFWHLAPDLKKSVNNVTDAFGRKIVVAIHVRGGDKIPELYGDKVDKDEHYEMTGGMKLLATRYPASVGATCVVVGDEGGLAEAVAKLAQEHLKCSEVVLRTGLPTGTESAGHDQVEFNKLPLSDRCARTNAFIADLEVMAAAHYFIGIPPSNVDNVVVALRTCVHFHRHDTAIDGNGRTFEMAG